jgi:hypothetical protein
MIAGMLDRQLPKLETMLRERQDTTGAFGIGFITCTRSRTGWSWHPTDATGASTSWLSRRDGLLFAPGAH